MESTSSAMTKFGLDLFRLVSSKNPNSNAFISPFSISVALSMTHLGAGGDTAQGMAKALCWEAGQETFIHEENQTYIKMLQQVSQQYILSLANRLFVEEGYALLPEFLKQTKELYLAEAVPAKFKVNSEEERVNINNWVSELTREKIKDLIAPGILDRETRMVLVNAIYFKGLWTIPFDAKDTMPCPFKMSATQTKNVPTMTVEKSYSFLMDDGSLGFSALELLYKGEELSMVILLPTDYFGLDYMVKTLSFDKLTTAFARLNFPQKVKLFLPKFEMTCSYTMKEPLSQMGMASAFNSLKADFSRMTGGNDLVVSEVIHKAFVKVDEEGSEAAAVTTVVMRTRCLFMEIELPVFEVDHPFLFVIRDRRVPCSILFMGRVEDPSV